MLRILHLADVHLDTTFASRSERVRRRLREGIRRAFVKAIDLALTDRLDAVMIAGDLFDGDMLSFTTERLILEQTRRLSQAGIPAFYATGNHDPSSMRTRFASLEWPAGFHVFRSRTPERVEIMDRSGSTRAVVIGAGHETAREEENLAALFPVSAGSTPHIGLLHTMVQSASSSQLHDRYAPCSLEDLRRTGYDYWALGHIHARQQVDETSNAWYSGNILGRNPRETGPRGALLARIERGKPADVEFIHLASVEWCQVEMTEIEAISNASQLEAAVRTAFEEARQQSAADDWIVVVNLVGRCPLEPDLRDAERRAELEEILADALSAVAVEIRTTGLTSPIDVDTYRDQPHLLGETLAVINELRKRDDTLSKLGADPLALPFSSDVERLEYLRSLLDDLEEEAVRRLLSEEALR